MLVQYLESATDSVIVRNVDEKPIGVIEGKKIMNFLRTRYNYLRKLSVPA